MSEFIIPSPEQAIASSMAEISTETPEKSEGKQPDKKVEVIPAKPQTMADVSDEAPVKAEEKKTEAVEDEPRENENTAQFIKRLKAERADALNRAKQMEEKLSSKGKEADPQEIAALRKEIEERDVILEQTAYEKTKKFKDTYGAPIEKAVTGTKDLIGKFTETKGVYERAMALEPKDRMEYLREHLGDAAGTVFERTVRIEELSKDRDAALSDRKQASEALASERQNGYSAKIIETFRGMKDDLTKRLSPLRGERAEEYWKQSEALLTGDAPQSDILSAAVLATLAPHYIELTKTQAAEIATLKARIAEDNKQRPGINGRGSENGKSGSALEVVDGRLPSIKGVVRAQVAELRN